MSEKQTITIIGGGLAGSEAAWQIAERNCRVQLIDMKPHKYSPAHSSENLAELVCSNSLRSNDTTSAVGLLKEEMRACNSLTMRIAEETKVPAGKALAVDREKFAAQITEILQAHPLIDIVRRNLPKFRQNQILLPSLQPDRSLQSHWPNLLHNLPARRG